MTAWERLQLLVGEFGEEQAERALKLLSPLIGADEQPDQQARQLPAFVGIGDSGRSDSSDISEHVDDLLAVRPKFGQRTAISLPCTLASREFTR